MERHFVHTVGTRIRQLRKEKGWTQTDLATACGFHQSYIGQIEQGQKNITLDTLEQLVHVLQVPVHALFNRVDDTGEDSTPFESLSRLLAGMSEDDQQSILRVIEVILQWQRRHSPDS